MDTVSQLIQDVALACLIPMTVGLARWRVLDQQQRFLTLFCAAASAVQIASMVLSMYFFLSNMFLFHIYVVVEFVFMVLVFRKFLGPLNTDIGLAAISGGFVTLAILAAFWWASPSELPVLSRSVSSILMTVFSALILFRLADQTKWGVLTGTPGFWAATSALLYFAGTLLLTIFGEWISDMATESYILLWTYHALLNLLFYVLFAVALFMPGQTAEDELELDDF